MTVKDGIDAVLRLLEVVLTWQLALLVGVIIARDRIPDVVTQLGNRIRKAGPLEFGEPKEAPKLTPVGSASERPEAAPAPTGREADDLQRAREEVYERGRGIFLVHTISPSKRQGQTYDMFIFLSRHKRADRPEWRADLSDVDRAEFFLGRFWDNQVFPVKNQGQPIGIKASAYGPTLCVCRLVFTNGEEAMLDRYLDFEMGKVLQARDSQ